MSERVKSMTEQTAEALEYSIAHWERLAGNKADKRDELGGKSCALCQMFFFSDCDGCPVKTRTGYRYCSFTPYLAADQAADRFGLTSSQFHPAAKAELEFLKSLRETPSDE
jgi:hypothetical protein